MTGTATNENGEYYLTIPSINQGKGELKIVFSFIGYKPQEVVYKNQKVINITLTEDVQTLETVNVIGQAVYTNDAGLPVKDMGVSNQRIDMKEMEEIQATSIEDALQGRLANVDIIASSGDPGSRMNIRIRGTSSLNASSEPLVVIDGIPFETNFQDVSTRHSQRGRLRFPAQHLSFRHRKYRSIERCSGYGHVGARRGQTEFWSSPRKKVQKQKPVFHFHKK